MKFFFKYLILFNQHVWKFNTALFFILFVQFCFKFDDYQNDIPNYILTTHKFFIQFTFWLMLIGIFLKKYTPQLLFLNLVINWFFWCLNIFDVLHFKYLSHIYASIKALNLFNANPQYSFVLPYLIVFSILLLITAFKKYRTFSRIFISLCGGAVLLTTVAFHYTQINIVLNDRKQEELVLVRNIILDQGFPQNCNALHYVCSQEDINDLKLDEQENKKILPAIENLKKYVKDKKLDKWDAERFNIDFSLSGDDVYIWAIAVRDNQSRYLIDRERVLHAWKISETTFSTLGIIADSFWNTFAIFLIFFHHYRLNKRRKNIQ